MAPMPRIPLSDSFNNVDQFVESLLGFASSSSLFRALCGGVHVLDIFTQDPSLFNTIIPAEWRDWLLNTESMTLLDLLLRADLDAVDLSVTYNNPPSSLLDYIKTIRSHSLKRSYMPRKLKQEKLPRHLLVGMIPKKVHEVMNFADYVDNLAAEVSSSTGTEITHFVDFGSGQNYLGRSLASPPYNKQIVAVESKDININGAKQMDVRAGIATKQKVMRNKKLYMQRLDQMTPEDKLSDKTLRRMAKTKKTTINEDGVDLRPQTALETIYKLEEGKGGIQYVENRLQDGDLSPVVKMLEETSLTPALEESSCVDSVKEAHSKTPAKHSLMAISIHSCGNLSHHGIRSLVLNPEVKAVAIVGCCYNLLTERLGPPSYKHPSLESLQPLNHRVQRESSRCDPHGFPMSERLAQYDGEGIRLNITARMMGVQAPRNWTEKESDTFFTRHFFRALLQKFFFDRGVVSKPLAPQKSDKTSDREAEEADGEGNFATTRTDPVIIGSLRKGCYENFTAYVRGAIAKLSADPEKGALLAEKMGNMTDEEIQVYTDLYAARKKEVSVLWSLMAFSAEVVETLIVVDRYLFLKEQTDLVEDCWVEPVFDYGVSPRNLVVVGVKK